MHSAGRKSSHDRCYHLDNHVTILAILDIFNNKLCVSLMRVGSSLKHRVTTEDNKLGVGKPFPGLKPGSLNNVDLYAVEKELYLGSLCEVKDSPRPWHFWMIMLKNGNFDTQSGFCPSNGKRVPPFKSTRFPCFGKGCMNQPILNHEQTELSCEVMRGGFNGTYDLLSDPKIGLDGVSFYEVVWEKKVGIGSWVFRHKLKTSNKYPWLMLYLRADATQGYSGGYHYDTRGMLKTVSQKKNKTLNLFSHKLCFSYCIMSSN